VVGRSRHRHRARRYRRFGFTALARCTYNRPVRELLIALALVLLVPAAASAASVTVPADVGVGPAVYAISGPVGRDQPLHFGLKLSVQAIIDRETLRQNEKRIPPKYRQLAQSVNEVRFSPSLLIPDSLILSPKFRSTGIYGVTWRPVGLSLPLLTGALRLTLDAGVLLTYAYLHSDVLPDTHFLRPGLDLGARAEVALSRSLLISLGWSSGIYVPERLGDLGAVAPLDQSIWHLGQAFLQLHVRFPYTARL